MNEELLMQGIASMVNALIGIKEELEELNSNITLLLENMDNKSEE